MFLVALFLYSWTLAPAVTLTDSGELIVVAHGLGIAHPPGFPLWVILAHLASLVPLGNVAMRINVASALFAALASAMLTLVWQVDYPLYLAASSERRARSGEEGRALRYWGAKDEVQPPVAFWCCACPWRGAAHGILRTLGRSNPRRGLYSQHAAHPRYLLSDASVAAVHHGR